MEADRRKEVRDRLPQSGILRSGVVSIGVSMGYNCRTTSPEWGVFRRFWLNRFTTNYTSFVDLYDKIIIYDRTGLRMVRKIPANGYGNSGSAGVRRLCYTDFGKSLNATTLRLFLMSTCISAKIWLRAKTHSAAQKREPFSHYDIP